VLLGSISRHSTNSSSAFISLHVRTIQARPCSPPQLPSPKVFERMSKNARADGSFRPGGGNCFISIATGSLSAAAKAIAERKLCGAGLPHLTLTSISEACVLSLSALWLASMWGFRACPPVRLCPRAVAVFISARPFSFGGAKILRTLHQHVRFAESIENDKLATYSGFFHDLRCGTWIISLQT